MRKRVKRGNEEQPSISRCYLPRHSSPRNSHVSPDVVGSELVATLSASFLSHSLRNGAQCAPSVVHVSMSIPGGNVPTLRSSPSSSSSLFSPPNVQSHAAVIGNNPGGASLKFVRRPRVECIPNFTRYQRILPRTFTLPAECKAEVGPKKKAALEGERTRERDLYNTLFIVRANSLFVSKSCTLPS